MTRSQKNNLATEKGGHELDAKEKSPYLSKAQKDEGAKEEWGVCGEEGRGVVMTSGWTGGE